MLTITDTYYAEITNKEKKSRADGDEKKMRMNERSLYTSQIRSE